MTIRSLPIFIAVGIVIAGCNSGGTTADNAAANNPPAATTTAGAPAATTTAGTADNNAAATTATKGSIVGDWTSDEKTMENGAYTFKDDGTAVMTGTDPTTKMQMESEATYKIDGDKFTLQPTTMKATPPEGADEKTKKLAEQINKQATPAALKDAVQNETITWKDADTFMLTDTSGQEKGKVTTFTRKK